MAFFTRSEIDEDHIEIYFSAGITPREKEYEGTLVGIGWEPRYIQSPLLASRYRYPQLLFTPLIGTVHPDHDNPDEKFVGGELNLGPAPVDAKIYLPQKPWPLEELTGDVVFDALRESIKHNTPWRRLKTWREFLDTNTEKLPQETVKLISSLL